MCKNETKGGSAGLFRYVAVAPESLKIMDFGDGCRSPVGTGEGGAPARPGEGIPADARPDVFMNVIVITLDNKTTGPLNRLSRRPSRAYRDEGGPFSAR